MVSSKCQLVDQWIRQWWNNTSYKYAYRRSKKKEGGEGGEKKEMIVKKSEAGMKEVKRQWIMERRL